MKMAEAKSLMIAVGGYRVHFEKREGGFLTGDYFPERGEPAIPEMDEAWALAEKFAAVNPSLYVNVYVVHAFDWTPVPNYLNRKLNEYPRALVAR